MGSVFEWSENFGNGQKDVTVMSGDLGEYEIRGKDAEGKGNLVDDGFIVKAGSLARREIVPSAQSTVPVVHKQLIADGVLVEDGINLRFIKDHLFKSPSGATAAMLGRTANGWKNIVRPSFCTRMGWRV